MNSGKVLVLILISLNLIFAEEVNSDSLHWNINPLKRQKLFYTSEGDLKSPPNGPCSFLLGCCFMPLAGCIMIGHHIFVKDTIKKDTIKEEQIKRPFWQKLGFGIEYSGGICCTGKDLAKYIGEMTFDPIELISAWLYWLNSIEANIYCPVSKKSGIEGGGGWWWTCISPSKYDNWKFNLFPIFLGYRSGKFGLNLEYIFLYAKDKGKTPGSTKKEGKGKGYVFNSHYSISKNIELILSLGWGNYLAKEYYPDHISEYIVNMCFNGIGFSVGYKFNLKGGVK